MEKPIVINITNLIGTLVVVADNENSSVKIQELVQESLLKAISKVRSLENPESHQDKTSSELKDSENQG